jgi:hypothetical protein
VGVTVGVAVATAGRGVAVGVGVHVGAGVEEGAGEAVKVGMGVAVGVGVDVMGVGVTGCIGAGLAAAWLLHAVNKRSREKIKMKRIGFWVNLKNSSVVMVAGPPRGYHPKL